METKVTLELVVPSTDSPETVTERISKGLPETYRVLNVNVVQNGQRKDNFFAKDEATNKAASSDGNGAGKDSGFSEPKATTSTKQDS